MQVAEAATAQARTELAIAEQQLARCQVKAPIRGRIARRSADAGTMLAVGAQIFTIVDDSAFEFRAAVPSADFGTVKRGATVTVTVDALPGFSTVGKVSRITPLVDVRSVAVDAPALTPRAVSDIADKLVKRRLENVSGVGAVNLVGEAKREIQVVVDRTRLEAYGLSLAQVIEALRTENIDAPAGTADRGATAAMVRVAARGKSAAEIAAIPVKHVGSRTLVVRDVAQVMDGVEEAGLGVTLILNVSPELLTEKCVKSSSFRCFHRAASLCRLTALPDNHL